MNLWGALATSTDEAAASCFEGENGLGDSPPLTVMERRPLRNHCMTLFGLLELGLAWAPMSFVLGCVVGVSGCLALEELDEASMISGGS